MSQGMGQQQSTQQNSSEILVIPYADTGGNVYNLPDNVIIGVYRKIVEQNLLDKVFYDGSIKTVEQFLAMMKLKSNLPVLAYNGELLGLAWLNDIAKDRALAHFVMFKEAWGKHTKEVGNKILDYYFSMENDQGENIFKVLIGNTPAWNKAALRYIKQLGFSVIGEIPHVGKISYLESDEHGRQKRQQRDISDQSTG
jgi:L-amino acid N-acyltransferase YncA